MRISTDKFDVGYVPDSAFYEVYLDGDYLKDCVTADDELGIAICHVRDYDGNLLIEGDEIVQTVKYGDVSIIRKLRDVK